MNSPLTQPPVITLTTDFGTDSHYVAQMKGVILARCRTALLVDITHRIAPQNIAQAAWLLQQTVAAFPEDTCHLVVVDPGVGTARRLVLARIANQLFLAPDNGVLFPLAEQYGLAWAYQLTERGYWVDKPSVTFHGRDILASVAGHLAAGIASQRFGLPMDQLQPLRLAVARAGEGQVEGEIVFADSFGNLITNIHRDQLPSPSKPLLIELPRQHVVCEGLAETYAQCAPGSSIALIGSNGQLEVAIVNGNAGERLSAAAGDPVIVRVAAPREHA
jgi:S-adenosylmethionine hydrolase